MGWADFITAPARAGRYLYPAGAAQFVPAPAPLEDTVARFLDKLRRRKTDTGLLSKLYFLLQPATQRIIEYELFPFIRHLSREAIAARTVSSGEVRGRVLWNDTVLLRAGQSIGLRDYVISIPERSSDLPENQLVKVFLQQLVEIGETVTSLVGTGAVLETVTGLTAGAARALRTSHLRELTAPSHVSTRMRQRAWRHKNAVYKKVATLQSQLEDAVRRDKWSAILRLLSQGWIAPLSDDDLFELYALVLAMDVIERELGFGEPTTYGLIRTGRREVAAFERGDGWRAAVFFDQSPNAALNNQVSEYKRILSDYYGLAGAEHRPDVLIRFTDPTGTVRVVLLEVKKTSDDEYTRSSVYKCLGYLRDFAELWSARPLEMPKVLLLFPTGIEVADAASRRDLMLIGGDQRDRLAELLGSVLAA
jgi:hypothetical protein